MQFLEKLWWDFLLLLDILHCIFLCGLRFKIWEEGHFGTQTYRGTQGNNMTRHFYQVPLWLLTLLDT